MIRYVWEVKDVNANRVLADGGAEDLKEAQQDADLANTSDQTCFVYELPAGGAVWWHLKGYKNWSRLK